MKKLLLLTAFVSLNFLIVTILHADTILFPYLASDGVNVTTIVSVVNKSNSASHLTYIYRYKNGNANLDAGCTTQTFTRPTHENDLVTFDVSGMFNSGNAMYNDADGYGGSFGLSPPAPIRGYLLVTHSDSTGTRVDVSSTTMSNATRTLYGEAVLLDITSGAAWGYRAQNGSAQNFNIAIPKLHAGLEFQKSSDSNYYSGEALPFTFFPRNIWTTRLFVTPLPVRGTSEDLLSDLTANIKLVTAKDPSSSELDAINSCGTNPCSETEGVFSRSGTVVPKSSGLGGTLVKCIGAVDLWSMMDSTQRSQLENSGGWAIVYGERTGGHFSTFPYVNIYKLEYVLNNASYGGTNNNAILITSEEN